MNLDASPPAQITGIYPIHGGGAGGGILLEAPEVTLGAAARLLVNGAAGLSGFDVPPPTSQTTMVTPGNTPGTTCDPADWTFCSAVAGAGAAAGGAATAAADIDRLQGATGNVYYYAGGGGGGLGYIRVNTATGNYAKFSDTIESGVLTTGVIGTR